ncbi:hypothetical protein [Arthrobacter sp. KK5.5]|uniref:hypothetical protein n=1 Tax=Arthrobacter sp. KK5.5 TaxID=3373084 RepID=UPI003EE7C49E
MAALVVGIVAVFFGVIPAVGFLSFVLGPVAIVLGSVALLKRRPNKVFAIVGIVTGALGLLAAIVQTVLAVFLVNSVTSVAGESESYTFEASGESYVVSYITNDIQNVQTESVTGRFSTDVEASQLFGVMYAYNDPGVTGEVRCRILDDSGMLVSEQSASGARASVECVIAEAGLP